MIIYSACDLVVCSNDLQQTFQSTNICPVVEVDEAMPIEMNENNSSAVESSDPAPSSPALILYTSGTTGRPKGVVHTHNSLHHMVQSVVECWQYTSSDKILLFLPLHHLHGLLNKLLCVLCMGGHVEFMDSSSPTAIWARLHREHLLRTNHPLLPGVTMFMAVPTIYSKLLEHARQLADSDHGRHILGGGIRALQDMRLHVSGSAALPDVTLASWRDLTGHTLLERYGMTEIGG